MVPELHIKLEHTRGRAATLVVTNLARSPCLLQMVQLRKLPMGVPSLRYFLTSAGGWNDLDRRIGKRFSSDRREL